MNKLFLQHTTNKISPPFTTRVLRFSICHKKETKKKFYNNKKLGHFYHLIEAVILM